MWKGEPPASDEAAVGFLVEGSAVEQQMRIIAGLHSLAPFVLGCGSS